MNRPRTPHHAGGFTLLELLITAVVVGTAFVAASWSMSATARTEALHAEQDDPALELAREIRELAVGLPREPSGTTGASSAAPPTALDGLVGAVFDPVLLADGGTSDAHDGWSQHVDLDVVTVSDPGTALGLDPAEGLPADGPWLYRLRVEMRLDGHVVDEFTWWIDP